MLNKLGLKTLIALVITYMYVTYNFLVEALDALSASQDIDVGFGVVALGLILIYTVALVKPVIVLCKNAKKQITGEYWLCGTN